MQEIVKSLINICAALREVETKGRSSELIVGSIHALEQIISVLSPQSTVGTDETIDDEEDTNAIEGSNDNEQ